MSAISTVRRGSTRAWLALPLAGAVLSGTGRAMAEVPAVVAWHRNAGYAWFSALAQPVSSAWSGSIGEVLALAVAGALAWAFFRLGWRGFYWLGFAGGLVIFAFYLSWGFAYHYPPLSERLAPARPLAETGGASLERLTVRAARLLTGAAAGAGSFPGSDEEFLARINEGLSVSAARLPRSLNATSLGGVHFGPVKFSRASSALSLLQLSGYYFPWTGEAQINAEMPRTLWPREAAHERAHQHGFARENEATVVGLLVCLSSTDPAVFYSGALGLFASLDRDLARLDGPARRRTWDILPARVKDDFGIESDFWKAREGLGAVVSEKVNDTYLKAQGVRSGLASYQETTRLLLQAIETAGLPLRDLLDEEKSGEGE